MKEKADNGYLIDHGVVSPTASVSEATVIVDSDEGVETLSEILKKEYNEGETLRVVIMRIKD